MKAGKMFPTTRQLQLEKSTSVGKYLLVQVLTWTVVFDTNVCHVTIIEYYRIVILKDNLPLAFDKASP